MSSPDVDFQAPGLDAEEARALFERELPTIQTLTHAVCRRYGLNGDEADSFASWVTLRILEDDVAILRKFEGRSSLRTYLSVIVSHLWRDYRVKSLGRWCPSAAARRLGPTAVLLDAYLNRRGHPLEEALQILRNRDDVTEDEATLRRYAAAIPRRTRRRFTSAEKAVPLAGGDDADASVLEEEAQEGSHRAREALEEALHALPDQDQVIVRMHYWEGLTLAAIARALRIEQKPLYRRMEANRRRLRAALEERGIEWADVAEMLPT